MENFIINPKDYQTEYIKNLNECFNGWGGEREYEWGLNRKIGEHSSDILLIENEQDGVIAGSAVSYRKLAGKDRAFDIGIMTGSWTLPAARKKGCFTKMINCSKDLCSQKNVPFLTAFVTETNASCRRLQSEGSFMFPTYHLFSPEEAFPDKDLPQPEVLNKKESNDLTGTIFKTVQKRQADFLNFSYTEEEFSYQYINRIKQTTILKINNDFAILEDGLNEVKILLLTYENNDVFKTNMKAVTNWCIENRARKTFFFTTRRILLDSCEEIGFNNLPGYFTILDSLNKNVVYEELFESLNINMADKM